MKKIKCLLKKDLTSIFRTKKFLIIFLVLIGFAIVSPISAKIVQELLKLFGEDLGELSALLGTATYIDSYVQLNGNLAEMFIFILIIMFASSIIKEKTSGTYLVLKMNGINKREFILSHVVAQLIVVTISYFLSIIVFLVTTYILFKAAFPTHWFYSLISLYLFIVFFVIMVNFISNFSKSTTQSMVLNFSFYFGILMLNMFSKIKYFIPSSLTDNVVSVLDGSITKECNISIISTFIWIIGLILILMLGTKEKISNKN